MQMKYASQVVGLLAMLSANAASRTCPAYGAAISYPDCATPSLFAVA